MHRSFAPNFSVHPVGKICIRSKNDCHLWPWKGDMRNQFVQADLLNNTGNVWQTPNQQDKAGGGWAFSSGSVTPPQAGETPALPILGVPFSLCTHPLMQNYHIWRVDRCEDGLVFKGSATIASEGGGAPSLPNFGGSFCIYAYTLCCRTTKCPMVTHMGVACF